MNICDAVIKVRIRLNLDFCLRNLDKKYLFEEYYIIKEQIKFNEKEKNKISFILKSRNEQDNYLKMNIYVLKMGIFRIYIDDYLKNKNGGDKKKKRFRVN